MKRLFLVILLVMFVAWSHVGPARRVDHARDFRPADEISRSRAQAHREARAARVAEPPEARREASRAAAEARRDAHRVMTEAKVEVRQALDEAAHDVREALDEAAQEIRQAVDGIPVPIVPGTRVTEAVAQPPAPAAAPRLRRLPPWPRLLLRSRRFHQQLRASPASSSIPALPIQRPRPRRIQSPRRRSSPATSA